MRYMKFELRFSLCRDIQEDNLKKEPSETFGQISNVNMNILKTSVPNYVSLANHFRQMLALTWRTGLRVNGLTSLIISISLKVRRSSQSTFTMWPCRWALVS